MSGHNRWSKIKHKKEATDAKKSKMWSKVIKELTVAARLGGGDPGGNPRLRTAVDKAREVNMPNDTIDRAIKKGAGGLDGVQYEEFHYEVFGPGGTAILVEIMTDNRNRTVSEVRSILTRNGGNLGAAGSVSHMFKKLGQIVYDKATVDENEVTDAAIELGADDVRTEGESLVVVSEPKEFERVRDGLEAAGLPAPMHAEVSLVPESVVHLEGKDAAAAVKLVHALEDSDDVQNVVSNMDVDESVLESVG
ncbi:MAG TPA: YebC/PmpR family DNA-binding transcriptional regulator [Polyangia bacterium]|nr:YebC/PmpR family DNA-binding transcriptional regulator [Polyangia bacterium]